MSDFQKELRALSGEEMRSWASLLLRRLQGDGERAAPETETVFSSARNVREETRTRAASRLLVPEEAAPETGRAEPEPESAREDALRGNEAAEGEIQTLRTRLESLSRERTGRTQDENGEERGESVPFSGPEIRYENAQGARGMEMDRVSEFFRRDSRRYDAGFRLY